MTIAPSGEIPIGFKINFYGRDCPCSTNPASTCLFVNNNGNVTFGGPLETFTPFGLVGAMQRR